MIQSKEKAHQETEKMIEAAKKEMEALRQKRESLEQDRKDLNEKIDRRASGMAQAKCYQLEVIHREMEEKRQKEYKGKELALKGSYLMVLVYGVLVTLFQVIRSDVLLQHFIQFFWGVIDVATKLVLGLWKVGVN